MAGGERPRAKILRRRQKIAEFHRLVTTHAGDRRLAAKVAVGELLHHLVAKPALIVEDIMGNTDGIGNTAGIMNILPGAAGALFLHRDAMIVKLQGNADDIIALIFQQGSRHRTVDTARHGDDDTGIFRRCIKS